MRKFM